MPNQQQNFQVGDKVEFTDRRGERVKGTITRLTIKQPGKRKFRQFGLPPIIHRVAEVVPDDASVDSARYYRVPLDMLKKTRGAGDAGAARAVVNAVKDARAQHALDRNTSRYNDAEAAGLNDLRYGDKVQVQIRDNPFGIATWKDGKFRGFTAAGRVKIELGSEADWLGIPRAKVISSPPKFVRRPQ